MQESECLSQTTSMRDPRASRPRGQGEAAAETGDTASAATGPSSDVERTHGLLRVPPERSQLYVG